MIEVIHFFASTVNAWAETKPALGWRSAAIQAGQFCKVVALAAAR